jgi:NADP-dependent 3-hydroxy acid dehydrogenase YdfG
MPLQGKVALITGASQGIGQAVARHLAGMGLHLVLSARSEQKLGQLSEEIQAGFPQSRVLIVPCDVKDAAQVRQLVSQALSEFSRIDVLINNAGVAPKVGLLQELSIEDIDRTIDTNLKGAIYCMHTVIPAMVHQHGGTIININSVAGKTAYPFWSVYDATKFGLHAVTEAVAEEQRSNNIKIIGIYPGAVATPIWEGLDPEDVAEAIGYILSQPEKVHVREITLTPLKPVL